MPDAHPAETEIAPVVKSVVVGLPPEAAFDLFTARAATWWPLATHSVFGEDSATCHVEGWVGGRFYETHRDGVQQSEWGRVLAWEPPRRLCFSFYPGREPITAQEVEVYFAPEGTGTRVTLTHRGWETYGEGGEKLRGGYEAGWGVVLGRFADAS